MIKVTNPFWLDCPILVTGASGLVGGWLVAQLVEWQADVVCLIRDWVPQSKLMSDNLLMRVKSVRGDVRDQALLERIIGEYQINTVFHLAAQTIVGVANLNPISTFETNIGGTWVLLEACRRSPTVKQILVASSDKAYGNYAGQPYDEDMPLHGRYPYDVSKACADLIAQSYAVTYGLPVAITRCGNFYGGGDLNWNRVIPGTIRSILRGQRPIIRSDGNFIRDFFYVEDGVAAILLLAEKLASDRTLSGQAFNFSNELKVTIFDLVTRITALMGGELAPEIQNNATNEIRNQTLNAAKARQILGWQPMFTLDEGLQKTIAWYKAFFERELLYD